MLPHNVACYKQIKEKQVEFRFGDRWVKDLGNLKLADENTQSDGFNNLMKNGRIYEWSHVGDCWSFQGRDVQIQERRLQ